LWLLWAAAPAAAAAAAACGPTKKPKKKIKQNEANFVTQKQKALKSIRAKLSTPAADTTIIL